MKIPLKVVFMKPQDYLFHQAHIQAVAEVCSNSSTVDNGARVKLKIEKIFSSAGIAQGKNLLMSVSDAQQSLLVQHTLRAMFPSIRSAFAAMPPKFGWRIWFR